MNKVEIVEADGVEHVIIYREDGSFLSTPKSIYDAQQAAKEAQSL